MVGKSKAASHTFFDLRSWCASGILELAGFLVPATQILGFAASGIETLIEIMLQVRKRPVDAPLHHGSPAERYSLPDF